MKSALDSTPVYIYPMHPEVASNHSGKCVKCTDAGGGAAVVFQQFLINPARELASSHIKSFEFCAVVKILQD